MLADHQASHLKHLVEVPWTQNWTPNLPPLGVPHNGCERVFTLSNLSSRQRIYLSTHHFIFKTGIVIPSS